jgi:2-polyprenyl-3-methyl-5-hydroxy-6-metoxy-1,4-benzoquinol methylase
MIDHFNPKLIKNLKVLDFGMGWGSLLLMFKALGTQCYGMELSQARIKEAKAKGLQILSKEEVGNHEFDIIVLNDVLEHLTHPRETLAWLAKHLKTDGIIKISVPNAAVHKKALAAMNWHAPRGTELNLNGISPMEHLNLFSNKTLNIAAQQAGLKPIKLKSAITINAKRSLKSSPLKSLAREHIKRIKPTNLYFSKT